MIVQERPFSVFQTFFALLLKEITVFKSDHLRVVINAFFWSSSLLIPMMFFLPSVGLPSDYARFMLPAAAASWGLFDIIANATTLISDILGDRVIEHELTLPIPQWSVFLKIALANAYRSFSTAIFIIPNGMLLVWIGKGLLFSHLNVLKAVLMLATANLFFGFLGIFSASFMKKVSDVRNVWLRMVFPLWWLGGFNNSWAVVQKTSGAFGKLMLLNPLVYVNEGMRAAVLGQEGFLNYWACITVVLCTTVICAVVGIKRFQARLDCL